MSALPPNDHNAPTVDLQMAALFFEQACRAHRAGDTSTFEAARTVLLVNLGLSTTLVDRSNPHG